MPTAARSAIAPGAGAMIWLNSCRTNEAVAKEFGVFAKNLMSLFTSNARNPCTSYISQ